MKKASLKDAAKSLLIRRIEVISYEEELHPALQDYSEEERQEISALYEESVNKVLRFLRYPSLRGRLRKQGLSMSILTRERLPGDK